MTMDINIKQVLQSKFIIEKPPFMKIYLLTALFIFSCLFSEAQYVLKSWGSYNIYNIHNRYAQGIVAPTHMAGFNDKLIGFCEHGKTLALFLLDATSDDTSYIDSTFISMGASIEYNNKMLFQANTLKNTPELWISDGTKEGTKLVMSGISLANPIAFNGKIYFLNTVPPAGLWCTDGTAAGTKEVAPALIDKMAYHQTAAICNNKLFFCGYDSVHGNELWATDGTAAHTELLKDLVPGIKGAYVSNMIAYKNKIVFTATDSADQISLWSSNGTADSTYPLMKLGASWQTEVQDFTICNNQVFYNYVDDYTDTFHLVTTDGTVSGTRLFPTNGSIYLRYPFFTYKDRLYINAEQNGQFGIYVTDGKTFTPLHDKGGAFILNNGFSSAIYKGKAYFVGNTSLDIYPNMLYVTDGTDSGTHAIQPFATADSDALDPYKNFNGFAQTTNKLFFSASFNDTMGNVLWSLEDTSRTGPRPLNSFYVVYPNPTNDEVNIAFDNTYKLISIKAFDVSGHVIGAHNFNNTYSASINLGGLASGIYFLYIYADDKIAVSKVVKR